MLPKEKGMMIVSNEDLRLEGKRITEALNNNDEGIIFEFNASSNANGASIYISAEKKGLSYVELKESGLSESKILNYFRDNRVLIRISDHGSSHDGINSGHDPDLDQLFGKVAYYLDVEGYVYEPTSSTTREVEIPEYQFNNKTMTVVSERITKKGNRMFTVNQVVPTNYRYLKK